MRKILVTAVGSELGISVLKALKLGQYDKQVFGTDIYTDVVGKDLVSEFLQVPLASKEDEFLSALYKIIESNRIQYLIPTSDFEITLLAKHKQAFLNQLNCHILINDYDEVNRFNDKWTSYLWYKDHGISTPKSHLIEDSTSFNKELKNLGFPFILKPRIGGGSRGIFKINSIDDFLKYAPVVPLPVAQEYLYPDNQEYTAGIFRFSKNEAHVIVLKRELKFGMTNKAWVVNDLKLENFVKDTIFNTNLYHLVNLQFRITESGPKVLEINPRFSGTTGIRTNFGFDEIGMWIHLLEGVEPSAPKIRLGCVYRYMEEQYHYNKS